MDDGIGDIMALLKKLGLIENTMVFFQGDNGATREPRGGLDQRPARGGSNHPLRGFKFSLFEGGIRIPALVSWPGVIPPRQVINEPGAAMDLLPTIAAAAQVPLAQALPAGRVIDGRDVMPMFTGKSKTPHEAIFWAQNGQLAVRRGRWKLVLDGAVRDGTPEGNARLTGDDAVFLSDLAADPGETTNLRRSQPALVEELSKLARHWLEQVKQPS